MHIFGGNGYTATGVGSKIERIYRDTQFLSIGGGAESIMTDFSSRQMIKQYINRGKLWNKLYIYKISFILVLA